MTALSQRARNASTADQCRAMGLRVGDTIEGTERSGDWWSTARLTLVWLGEERAVFRVTKRSSTSPEWGRSHEDPNWTLEFRDWKKVAP